MKKIPVRSLGYLVVMDEDGEWHCPHENVEFEYDAGGDGWTEPGASWGVHCFDCEDDDMRQSDVDRLIDNHLSDLHDNQENDDE